MTTMAWGTIALGISSTDPIEKGAKAFNSITIATSMLPLGNILTDSRPPAAICYRAGTPIEISIVFAMFPSGNKWA